MEKHAITIRDIARALNISVSTVSRALRDSASISAERRRLIQQYAHEHGYHPNALAAALRTSHALPKSNLIGVVLPEFEHYYFASILTAIEETCRENGYFVVAAQTGDSYERERRVVEAFHRQHVAGIIISQAKDTTEYAHIEAAIADGIPMVFVDRICTGVRTSRVVVDDYAASYAATEHLIACGCRRIAFLGSTMNLEISKNRFIGYRDAMHRHGLQVDERLVCQCDNRGETESTVPQLMNLDEHPDAFFAINDDTALGVLYTCRGMGYRVPEDVCICGFTDSILARSSDPQLTTIAQRGRDVGRMGAQVMMDTISGAIPEGHYVSRVVKTQLVVRGTTRN
ncbi:MAG: LacI family DNA-binding transcriptional regulator [Bacteroidaceae bacterium]|nr:LacI family DNA-binding transcriptional regulator [Bacteroidaceae bacterium]